MDPPSRGAKYALDDISSSLIVARVVAIAYRTPLFKCKESFDVLPRSASKFLEYLDQAIVLRLLYTFRTL